MNKQRETAQQHAARGRRYKHHEIDQADGGRLVLGVDGSIRHVDDHGSTTHTWSTDDAEWADQAIRFGLHPQPRTVAPQGHQVQETKNKRW